MKHYIHVLINGSLLEVTAHTDGDRLPERHIDLLEYLGEVGPDTKRAIEAQGLELSDLLEVTRHYMNSELPTCDVRSFHCGAVHVEYVVPDPDLLFEDLQGTRLYSVRVTDCHGLKHEGKCRAYNSFGAVKILATALRIPIRNSVAQPLELTA